MSRWRASTAPRRDECWQVEPKSSLRRRERAVQRHSLAYQIDAEAEVVLQDYPWLLVLLDEACAKLREIYGDEPRFEVERFDDPESPETAPTLFLVIRTARAPHEADEALDRFDETWWLDNLDRAQGKLEIAIKRT